MTDLDVDPAKDAADDLRRLLTTSGVVLATFSIGAATQSVFVYAAPSVFDSTLDGVQSFIVRTIVNLLACAAALMLCAWVRLPALSPVKQVLMSLAISGGVSLARFGVQRLVGIYPDPSMQTSLVEIVSAAAVVALAIGLGMAQMLSQARLRTQERAAAEQRLRATTALAALAEEELRVRRSVAEGLHGGLQARLVMVRVQLDSILDRWGHGRVDDGDRAVLEQVRDELDTLREDEVRQLSHLLYPAGVDVGLAHAVRRLVRRVPSQIETDADIDEAFDEPVFTADEPGEAIVVRRVAVLRAAEEGINNALLHGGADRIGIGLHLRHHDDGDRVLLTVDDNGSGMPAANTGLRGLARSDERLSRLGGSQRLDASPWGGVRLIVELPVHTRHPAPAE
ncbi:sensor histidine kinase [Microbacterium sp. NPDC058345]|uniref:sensor histidine kinase n=1 Tax=Microbacterium sp. NPDC058345 TaxID=3346455 RepID=UPI00365EAB8F